MKRARLPIKWSFWISSALTLLFLGLAGVITILWYREMEKRLDDHGTAAVRTVAIRLDKIFIQTKLTAELIAKGMERKTYTKDEIPGFIQKMITTVNAECPEIIGMAIAYKDGMLVEGERYNGYVGFIQNGKYQQVHWDNAVTDYFSRDWYRDPIQNQESLWTKPFKAEAISGETLSSYAVPFYSDKDGRRLLAGVILLDLTVGMLDRSISEITLSGFGSLDQERRSLLTNDSGLIVAAPGREFLRNQNIRSLCVEGEERATVSDLFPDDSGRCDFPGTISGGGQVDCFYAKCLNGWVVTTAVSANWRRSIFFHLVSRVFFVCLFLLALTFLVVFLVSFKLSRPLEEFSRAICAVGEGDFASPLPVCRSGDEIAEVTDSLHRIRDALLNSDNKSAAYEWVEEELNAARSVQEDILPLVFSPFADFREVTGAVDLVSGQEGGGAFYDVIPVDGDRLALIVGEVLDHGVSAALLMSAIQTLQRKILLTEKTPSGLVAKLNALLSDHGSRKMTVSYWVGILNAESGELAYSSGSLYSPIRKRVDGSVEFLRDRHGPPLGTKKGSVYGESSLTLTPGDFLVCYSAGVPEVVNRYGNVFGEKNLLSVVQTGETKSPWTLLDMIETEVNGFRGGANQTADVTLLIARFQSGPKDFAERFFPAEKEILPTLMAFVQERATSLSLDTKAQYRLQLAVEEIFVNIASYAYSGGEGKVGVQVWTEDRQLRVRFADSGVSFDPLKKEDPNVTIPAAEREIGGLGIFVVKKNVDYISYQRLDGNNVLTIGVENGK